jgi:hypothetical protein
LIIDAQNAKNTNSAEQKGYDAGKKVSGIKRHIAVDTQGLPVAGQDVVPLFWGCRRRFFLRRNASAYGGWFTPSRLSGCNRPQPLARQGLNCVAQPPGAEISSRKEKTRKQFVSQDSSKRGTTC